MLAPIILFTYNRPWHTRQTVEALKKNELATQSDLIIFSDAPKNTQAEQSVQEVREFLRTIDGFNSVKIIERNENWGLAKSIIDGVTDVVNEYGRVIVLEDDIVTSPFFLSFMNDALKFYKDYEKIWHISGWNYPIKSDDLSDVFLWRVMNCWGWATWQNKWRYFQKNPQALISNFSKSDIYRFDLDGSGIFWSQVLDNMNDKLNTWAIFWYATIFKAGGLCVNPSVSYVRNIGLDGSGQHCGESSQQTERVLSKNKKVSFISDTIELELAVKRIKEYYRKQNKTLIQRVIFKIIKILRLK